MQHFILLLGALASFATAWTVEQSQFRPSIGNVPPPKKQARSLYTGIEGSGELREAFSSTKPWDSPVLRLERENHNDEICNCISSSDNVGGSRDMSPLNSRTWRKVRRIVDAGTTQEHL